MAKTDRLDDAETRSLDSPASGHLRTPQPGEARRIAKQSGEQPSDSGVTIAYAAGQIIAGKYQLRKELGTGGMGAVWAAYNVGLDTQVAIKLLRPDLKAAGLDHRFLNEARASARLGHPAIVRVFDFGRTEQRAPFIVMELLEGESLGDSLGRHSRAPAVRAVQIMLPIADALAQAHAKGIVHRDLKPDNVFLASSGSRAIQPKILDFGIAKLAHEEGVSRRTQHGMVMGSPEYMAPEQARGQSEVDHRVDIWSFAVVLYELLWGEPPFIRENYNATMRAIIEDPVRPLDDICDPALWQIIERGLKKAPDERWQSMREFGRVLARWLLTQGVSEDVCHASLEATWLTNSIAPQVDDVFSAPVTSRSDDALPAAAGYKDSGPHSRPRTPLTLEQPRPAARELPTLHEQPLRPRRRGRIALIALLLLGAAGVFAFREYSQHARSFAWPWVEPPAAQAPRPTAEPAPALAASTSPAPVAVEASAAPPPEPPPSAPAAAAESAASPRRLKPPVARTARQPAAPRRQRPASAAKDLKEPW